MMYTKLGVYCLTIGKHLTGTYMYVSIPCVCVYIYINWHQSYYLYIYMFVNTQVFLNSVANSDAIN